MKNIAFYFVFSGAFLVVIATIIKLTQSSNSAAVYIAGLVMTLSGLVMLFVKSKIPSNNDH